MRRSVFAVLLLPLLGPSLAASETPEKDPPPGFVDLAKHIPGLRVEARYAGRDNFLGAPVDGYRRPRAFATERAAEALAAVHQALEPYGLGLLVYDAYRPQRAVDHFVRWAADPADQAMKASYYPHVDKSQLFALGYIAEKSGHTRGSTVDLTICRRGDGQALDMGSPWDLFDPISWPTSPEPTPQARANRLLLRTLMLASGFKPYDQEWWHFTLVDEPHPDTYFNFPVE